MANYNTNRRRVWAVMAKIEFDFDSYFVWLFCFEIERNCLLFFISLVLNDVVYYYYVNWMYLLETNINNTDWFFFFVWKKYSIKTFEFKNHFTIIWVSSSGTKIRFSSILSLILVTPMRSQKKKTIFQQTSRRRTKKHLNYNEVRLLSSALQTTTMPCVWL